MKRRRSQKADKSASLRRQLRFPGDIWIGHKLASELSSEIASLNHIQKPISGTTLPYQPVFLMYSLPN